MFFAKRINLYTGEIICLATYHCQPIFSQNQQEQNGWSEISEQEYNSLKQLKILASSNKFPTEEQEKNAIETKRIIPKEEDILNE